MDIFTKKESTQSPPLEAIIGVDINGWPFLIKGTPNDWWTAMLMGDSFVDVFENDLTPTIPGIYRWTGNFKSNANAGRSLASGEIDDWPGTWTGTFTQIPEYTEQAIIGEALAECVRESLDRCCGQRPYNSLSRPDDCPCEECIKERAAVWSWDQINILEDESDPSLDPIKDTERVCSITN